MKKKSILKKIEKTENPKKTKMSYIITKKIFPKDIANIIMSFLVHPKQEQWAKYWGSEVIKNFKTISKHIYFSCARGYKGAEYGSVRSVIQAANKNFIENTYHLKFRFNTRIQYELNDSRSIYIKNKYALSKLHSRIFINNKKHLFRMTHKKYNIVDRALKMLINRLFYK